MQKIAAVVVTYNKKDLLLENLEAICSQTVPPDAIYIIDNLSDDGTPELLKEKEFIDDVPENKLDKDQILLKDVLSRYNEANNIRIKYILKKENDGGAGGFYKGIKVAYEDDFDWVWVMDDDTIPRKDTLKMLLADIKEIGEDEIIIGSTAVWEDEQYHPMNFPVIKPYYKNTKINHLSKGILPIESTSFVSLLINRQIIQDVGYPIKNFFIWNDDYEYTKRITNRYKGFCSLRSKVLHKTERKHQATEGYSWKYYYEIRNKLWLIFKLKTFSRKERLVMLYNLSKSVKQHFANVGFHKKNFKMVFQAFYNGIFSRP